MKISPVQLKVLRALAEPGARLEWFSKIGWCFVSLINPRTLTILSNNGLINPRKSKKILTAAGRAYLASLEGKNG